MLLLIGLPGTVGAEPQAQVGWSYTTGGSVVGVAVSSDGSFTAACSQDGYVYGFHKNGTLWWKTQLDSLPQALAASSWGDRILAGDDSRIYLLNMTGQLLWKRDVLNTNDVAASPDGSFLVAGTSDGFVRAYDAAGSLAWSYKTPYAVQAVGVSEDGSRVAAGTSDGMVYLLDQGGAVMWSFDIGRFINDIAVAGESVLVATERNRIFYLRDGAQERSDYYPSDPLALGPGWGLPGHRPHRRHGLLLPAGLQEAVGA
ncbi:MAG: WD40 repeat domain-containing protein [Euryarchaeota archaeon]|nr:WD40 repeat domain-containing protein [Euryarchaeota archaeon]